ncbi:hypothetical protein [Streptomyces sp. NPDC087300]|uniref:hypothetical protein n=1 Tax=Streptomyces sp. NPDC087300 TaxID=3365780 RepID=UPI0038052FD7
MPSATGELRHVMLGPIFRPEVPPRTDPGHPSTCHASATGKGKLHGSPECRAARWPWLPAGHLAGFGRQA